MQVSYGTPVGIYVYDGTNTYQGAGQIVNPTGSGTFPATLDPTGATPVVVGCSYDYLSPYGINGGTPSAVNIFNTSAAASAYISGLITANPSSQYFCAYPAYTSSPRTFTNTTRSVNTAFQISVAQDAEVAYAVDVSVTSPLLAGTQGTVTLQYADNSAFTTNVKTVDSGTNSTSGVLNLTNVGTVFLGGIIPAGKYVMIVTANTTGSPTFSVRPGQEVLL